jgi:hypothetical protein
MKIKRIFPERERDLDGIDLQESETSHGRLGAAYDAVERLEANIKKHPNIPELQEDLEEIRKDVKELEELEARNSRGQKESLS